MVSQVPPRRFLIGLLLLIGVGGLTSLAAYQGWRTAEAELQEQATSRLSLYGSSLRGAIAQYQYLPFILSEDPSVQALLRSQDFTRAPLQAHVSRKLQRVAERSGAALLYVLDDQGTTVASSNFEAADSLIGKSFLYRPYFQQAYSQRTGRFYAIGTTTGQPGYYISHSVSRRSTVAGVTVVKISLEGLQTDWSTAQENVLVADARGVIALSSRKEWRFQTLRLLSEEDQRSIQQQRQYEGVSLAPLGAVKPSWWSASRLLTVPEDAVGEYMVQELPLEELGWTLYYLTPLTPVQQRAGESALAALGILGLLSALALFQRERLAKMRSLQESRDQLEQRVDERTRELQATQRELIQAGKLAALGQMSAAVAHELNQPLTAMQTFVASSRLLLQKKRVEVVEENLERLLTLVQSVSAIARQLKVFARKSEQTATQANLNAVLRYALDLFVERREDPSLSIRTEGWEEPIEVTGDPLQLQQLFVNLISNALDVMEAVPHQELIIRAAQDEHQVQVEFLDTGPGIDPEDLPHLFEPFFTRKQDGQGLGLGLSIAYGIAQAHRGHIRAANRDSGGAAFILVLPLAAYA